jgi:8-oxo-dGTP diphosphatase
MPGRVHVVVGVIRDGEGNFLIAQRHADSHQGGLWEFPGGKLEAGESAIQALRRELEEELSIQLGTARELLKIEHDYVDKAVLLDVWLVETYTGQALGSEGQPLRWVTAGALTSFSFPAANKPIVEVCQSLVLK